MSHPSASTRAAIYVRVSSDEQVENTSLATQRKRCRAHCDAMNWTVNGVYADEGVSGAKASRPQLDAMMAACRAGQLDVIVVLKTDRFSRSRAHLFNTLEELAKLDVGFVSVSESFDTTTTAGDAMAGMLGVFAQMERNVIRDRTRAGVNAKVRAGGWGGGNEAPYGYKIVGQKRDAHLEIDEREAEMIKLAVSLLIDQRLTSLEAAMRLNALGQTPRKAPLWTSQNLRNMLCRGQWDGQWVFAKKSKRTKGTTPPITVPVPPILPPATLAALRGYLESTTLIRGRKSVHPLSGRLFCPCGMHMTGIARGDRANRRYRCRNARNQPGRPFCALPSVLADRIDDAVWAEVLKVLTDENYLRELAREHLGLAADATKVSADMMAVATAAVERTRRNLATATARAYSDDLDDETRTMVTSSLNEQYRAALAHQAMMAQVNAESGKQSHRLDRLDRVAQMAAETLADADVELRAQVIDLLDVRVDIIEHATLTEPMRIKLSGVVDDIRLSESASVDWHPTVGATANA